VAEAVPSTTSRSIAASFFTVGESAISRMDAAYRNNPGTTTPGAVGA
jgi:hypothetical protein